MTARLIISEHDQLGGLSDDDHTNYLTEGRADTWFATKDLADLNSKDHADLDLLGADDHTQYLLITGTRAMTGDLDMDSNDIDDAGAFNLDNGAQFGVPYGGWTHISGSGAVDDGTTIDIPDVDGSDFYYGYAGTNEHLFTGNIRTTGHAALGLSSTTLPTGHILLGSEHFTGTGNKVGVGMFPVYIMTSPGVGNLYGVQGNVFFGGDDWAAGSNINALQFYPAPDYQHGSTDWGNSNLRLLGITTGGLINIFGRTVTAKDIIGIQVNAFTHIFGAIGAVTADDCTGVHVYTPSATTGWFTTLTGIRVDPQNIANSTIKQGIWLAGDGVGSDIVFGAGKDAHIYYNNTDLVIDSQLVGSGDVLFPNDNQALALGGGAGGDARIYYDGADLQIDSSLVAASDIDIACGANKTIELQNTVWEDLRIPIGALIPGATPPTLATFVGSISVYLFTVGNDDEVYLTLQIPHSYTEGTDIYPHLHWAPISTNTGNVLWKMEYQWKNIGQAFTGATTTIQALDAGNGTLGEDQVAAFPSISGSGMQISSMLTARLYRNGSDGTDTYTTSAALLEFDLHFEVNTMGSRQEFIK